MKLTVQEMLQVLQEASRATWPSIRPQTQVQTQARDTSFKFEALEALWDPRTLDCTSAVSHSSAMPRAGYELDCPDWVRAPLSSDGVRRGLVQLACLVSDSSLHVYDDHDRAIHVGRFARRVDEDARRKCGSVLDMHDDDLLSNSVAMDALSHATNVDLLVDGGACSFCYLTSGGQAGRPCAWLLRDVDTNTWGVRVFDGPCLTANRAQVQTMAFLKAIRADDPASPSVHRLTAACRRSGIRLPKAGGERAAVLEHLREVALGVKGILDHEALLRSHPPSRPEGDRQASVAAKGARVLGAEDEDHSDDLGVRARP